MSSEDMKKNPLEFGPLEPEEADELKKYFTGVSFEFARVGPKGYIMSADYEDDAKNIYNTTFKSDDVIVSSFPRSGTTWTQELVWLIVNDLDYETARATPLTTRYIFLEFPSILNGKALDKIIEKNKSKGINYANAYNLRNNTNRCSDILMNQPSPRFIKTHLPLSLLPPTILDTTKVVYVARDPRDTAVSFYHLNKDATYVGYKGDFKTYWNLFIKNLILWSPYFDHLKESWAQRHHPNLLFLFYEELSKDLPGTVRRVADFFGKKLSEEQIADLSQHLKFENLKKNDSVNLSEVNGYGLMLTEGNFVRKGKTGGWRELFDEEMTQQAERWMADNLRDTDLRFPHLN